MKKDKKEIAFNLWLCYNESGKSSKGGVVEIQHFIANASIHVILGAGNLLVIYLMCAAIFGNHKVEKKEEIV